MWDVIETWNEWRQLNVLPYRGDLLDQPGSVFEAIKTCENVRAEFALKAQQTSEQQQTQAQTQLTELVAKGKHGR